MRSQDPQGWQRAPHERSVPAVGTLCDVNASQLLHPLGSALLTVWGRIGQLTEQLPALAQRAGLAAVGEEADVPDAHEARR